MSLNQVIIMIEIEEYLYILQNLLCKIIGKPTDIIHPRTHITNNWVSKSSNNNLFGNSWYYKLEIC